MGKSTSLVAEYLDARAQRGSAPAFGVADADAQVLGTLRDLNELAAEPDWQRAQLLQQMPALDGYLIDGDHTTVFIRGKQKHAIRLFRDGRVEELSAAAANAEYKRFCRADIARHSTADMALFDMETTRDGGREVLIAGRSIRISAQELASLRNGARLPDSHPLTAALLDKNGKAKVLYSNPMMQKQGPAMRDADEFAFMLQRAYPEAPVYRDPLSDKTNELVKKLSSFTVSGPKDVMAIVAEDSFRPRPNDYNLIQDLKQELTKAGVQVASFGPKSRLTSAGTGGKGLIVITGHSGAELAAFVRALGEQGAFRNNFVMFNSCETPLSRQLITEINTRYGAIATFAHQGKIQVHDLDAFLAQYANRLSNGERRPFQELLIRTLHEHKLNGIWTVCLNWLLDGGRPGVHV